MDWTRYAIYWLPDGPLGRAGVDWLGWDARAGHAIDGADPCTEVPRKYGFHATIKPPFRLADGTDEATLRAQAAALAGRLAAVELGRLTVTHLGHFLALTPEHNPSDLAATIVAELDGFRAPPTPNDLARRRASGLSPDQDARLLRWGYPHVMEGFRMHLTLTGPNPPAAIEARLADRFGPLSGPYRLDSLSLAGQAPDGRFHLIADLPLGAHAGASAKADKAAPTA